MKIVQKIGLIILFGVIFWLAIFIPIDTATTFQLFLICYSMSLLLALAFIYVDKKRNKAHGIKKIFLYSLLYGSICFGLFYSI